MANKNEEAREKASLSRRRKLRQLLGLAVCVLVIVGAISTVSGAIKLISTAFDDTEEKTAYENRLLYIVAYNPVPFNSLSEANTNLLLEAAIWQTIANSDVKTFEHDEVGSLYMPTLDIDKTIASLYGPDVKFTHESFDSNMSYTYVPEKQAYLIPVTGATLFYTPRVEKIKREGDNQRVTVGYISNYGANGEYIASATSEPSKYYDYIFTKINGTYYLSAIETSEMQAKANAAANSTSSSGVPAELIDPNAAIQDAAESIIQENAASSAESTSESNPESTPAA